MESTKKYFAFISYKREDEKWAKWLQHKLEHYKLPSNLNGRIDLPKEIRPVFKDTSELNPGNLPQQIHDALEQSKYLIVICSPRSAKSEWVNHEVETFIEMGKIDKIIPFIIEGSAFSKDPENECFPKALRELPSEQELLGANINEMGKDAAVVKTVSFMFELRFDELWQRFEREQRKNRNVKILSVSALVIVALVVTGWIWMQRTKNEARIVSEKANELTNKGLSYVAQKALIEVLPENLKRPDRPYVAEAEKALRHAVKYNTELLGNVADAIYSPDGEKLLIVDGRTLRIWDTEKRGDPLQLGNIEDALKADYSPDGKRIVVGCWDGSIKIVDAVGGNVISSMKTKIPVELTMADDLSIVYSPDGRHVVSIACDYHQRISILQMWDVENGNNLYKIELEELVCGSCDPVHFSPDGKRILLNHDGLKVLDAENGEKLFDLAKEAANSAFYWPSGDMIFSSGSSGMVNIWNAENGEKISSQRIADEDYAMTCIPSGMVAIASENIWIIDLVNNLTYSVLGAESFEDYLPDSCNRVSGFAVAKLNPNRRQLLSISSDGYEGGGGELKIWTVDYADCTLYGSGVVNSISFSPDERHLVTTGEHMVRVWDVNRQKEEFHFTFPYVVTAFYTSDGKRIIAQDPESFSCWDAENGNLLFRVDGITGSYGEIHVAYDPVNEMVIAKTKKGVCLFDDKTGNESALVAAGSFTTISYNSTNRYIVLTKYDAPDQVLIFDAQTREPFQTVTAQEELYWGDAFFSPDGKELLYYANYEQQGCSPVYIMNFKTGKLIHELEHTKDLNYGHLESVSYSSDGKWIVTVSGLSEIKVWDAKEGIEIASFEGLAAEFSPDSRKLVVVQADNTIRIIDFPPLQELIDRTRERFKDKPLTHEERRFYHLE